MGLVKQLPLCPIHHQLSTVQIFFVWSVSGALLINVFHNLVTVTLNLIVRLISFAFKVSVLIDVRLFDVLMDLNVPKANVFQLHLNADMDMIALQAKNAIIKVVVLTSVMVYFVLQLIDVLMVNVLGYVKIQGAQTALDVIMVNANQFKDTVRPLHNAETLKFAI